MSNKYLNLPLTKRLELFKKQQTLCCGWRDKTPCATSPSINPMPLGIRPPDERRISLSSYKLASSDYQWCEDPQDAFCATALAYDIGRENGYHRSIHLGWYVDHYQNETTSGVVFTLPGRRGFVAGCTDPWNCDKQGKGPAIIDVTTIYEDELKAARAAENIAERYGEFCREDDAKQTAEADIEAAQERATEIRNEIIELIHAIKRSTLDPLVCRTLKGAVRELLHAKTECYDRIEKLKDNYWNAVES